MALTEKQILKLRPEFKFGGIAMVEWFEITKEKGYCCIRSGLRHADGVTKSPYYYEDCIVDKNATKTALCRFNEFYEAWKN